MDYYCNYSLVTSDINNGVYTISVWDGHTGVNLMTLSSQKIAKNSLTVIKDTAFGCVENKSQIEIWKLKNEERKKVIAIPASARAIVYNKLENMLASFVGYDVFIWQAVTGVLISTLCKIHSHSGTQILFFSNKIITVDESGLIVCSKIIVNENCDVLWKSRQFSTTKLHVTLIENRNELFVISQNGKFIILDLNDGQPKGPIEELSLTVSSITCLRNQVYIGCNQGMLAVYSTMNGQIKKTCVIDASKEDRHITMMSLSPDQRSLVMVVDDRTAITISTDGFNLKQHRQFSFGFPVTNLCTVTKAAGMFSADSDQGSSILIKQLNFSLADKSEDASNTRQTVDDVLSTRTEADQTENLIQILCSRPSSKLNLFKKPAPKGHLRKTVNDIIAVLTNK